MTDRRRSILLMNLESQLFLHTNKRFWTIRQVHDMIQNGRNERHDETVDDDEEFAA